MASARPKIGYQLKAGQFDPGSAGVPAGLRATSCPPGSSY